MSAKESVLAVIPARFGSTRFPGKPLHPILGKTLLQRTYENTLQCSAFDSVVVATDHPIIYDHITSFGGKAIMTSESCPTGTDRIAEALHLEPSLKKFDLIVNMQGDHPCIAPKTMEQLVHALQTAPDASMATAAARIESEQDALNPNIVKCVMDLKGYAIYFSRALIPAGRQAVMQPSVPYYHHLGIYAFRRDFLFEYNKLPATPLQLAEDLEQLKILEHGYRIKVVVVEDEAIGVDRLEDINKVEEYLCKQQNIFLSQAELSPR